MRIVYQVRSRRVLRAYRAAARVNRALEQALRDLARAFRF